MIKKALEESASFESYQSDPVGFCEDTFGEVYTDDVKTMMESVRDNVITVAKSCNASGKTHAAARMAAWFIKCFPNSQVYTAAAPPEDNLKKLLWGELGSLINKFPKVFEEFKQNILHLERNPRSFLTGVTIPQSGDDAIRQAKFCTDADELFELTTGDVVTYKSLIGKKVKVVSFNDDFNKKNSKAEFFNNGIEPIYEIVLSSGHRVRRTGKHPLFTGKIVQSFKTMGGSHVKGRYCVEREKWTFVEEIKKGDAVLIPEDTSFNFGALTIESNEIKVLAYLIGNGCINSGKKVLFINQDNKQLAEFKAAVSALGAKVVPDNLAEYSWRVNGDGSGKKGSNPILNLLRHHNLIGKDSATKQVPKKINQAKRECIALFLNRLFSTDGYACICKAGAYRKAEIGYTSKSEGLIRDIQRLLFRFGIAAKIAKQKKSWTHKGVRKSDYYWSLTICRAEEVVRFYKQIGIYGKEEALKECVKYSRERQACATWRKSKHNGFGWEKVKSVELVGKKPTVGVYVPDNNTYLTNLAEHNSGKHAPYLFFILDEGDAIPDAVYKGIESCMSGGYVRLLIMFNPRAEAGPVYRMERDRLANIVTLSAFNHPNVVTGEIVIPGGAVDRETTVRRINQWCRRLNDNEPREADSFELPAFLVGAVAKDQKGKVYPPLLAGFYKIINSAFSYMVLGQYPAQGVNQLISREWTAAARARWDLYVSKFGEVPPKDVQAVMGFDVAEMGGDLNKLFFRYGGYVERCADDCTWGGIDIIESGDRGSVQYHKRSTRACLVDANGVGAGIAPHMRRLGCNSYGIKVQESPTDTPDEKELGDFKIMRDQLWWKCREWLRTDTAMLPPDEELLEELHTATYEVKGKYIRVMDKDTFKELLKRSPNSADALCLTFAPIKAPILPQSAKPVKKVRFAW